MFKRGGALSTSGIFKPKENMKYLKLILMEFNNKNFRENPSQTGVFKAEQAISIKILQWIMRPRHGALVITHGNGALRKDPPRSIHTLGLK